MLSKKFIDEQLATGVEEFLGEAANHKMLRNTGIIYVTFKIMLVHLR